MASIDKDPGNLVAEVTQQTSSFLEENYVYVWIILIALLFLYFTYPKLKNWISNSIFHNFYQKKLTVEQQQQLDEQVRIARLKQQEMLQQDALNASQNKKKEIKKKPKSTTNLKPQSFPLSGDFASGPSYRPSSNSTKRGS